jgi:hypothetical protein
MLCRLLRFASIIYCEGAQRESQARQQHVGWVERKRRGIHAQPRKRYPSLAVCEDDGFRERAQPILRATRSCGNFAMIRRDLWKRRSRNDRFRRRPTCSRFNFQSASFRCVSAIPPRDATLPQQASAQTLDRVWLPRQYRHDAKPASQRRACAHRRETDKATRRYRLRSNRPRPRRRTCLHGRTLLIFALWLLPLDEVRGPPFWCWSIGRYQDCRRSIDPWNTPHHMNRQAAPIALQDQHGRLLA